MLLTTLVLVFQGGSAAFIEVAPAGSPGGWMGEAAAAIWPATISAGGVIAGTTTSSKAQGSVAFTWTARTGLKEWPTAQRQNGGAYAVSGNAQVMAGTHVWFEGETALGKRFKGRSWAALSEIGLTDIGCLITGMNTDGTVLVGTAQKSAPEAPFKPFRWSPLEGVRALLYRGKPFSGSAEGVSSDGHVVCGVMSATKDSPARPYVWTRGTGAVPIKLPRGVYCYGPSLGQRDTFVSKDGRIIGFTAGNDRVTRAYLWSHGTGLRPLHPSKEVTLTGLSEDGRVAVGRTDFGPFVWSQTKGLLDLGEILTMKYGQGAKIKGKRIRPGAVSVQRERIVIAGTLGVERYTGSSAFVVYLPFSDVL